MKTHLAMQYLERHRLQLIYVILTVTAISSLYQWVYCPYIDDRAFSNVFITALDTTESIEISACDNVGTEKRVIVDKADALFKVIVDGIMIIHKDNLRSNANAFSDSRKYACINIKCYNNNKSPTLDIVLHRCAIAGVRCMPQEFRRSYKGNAVSNAYERVSLGLSGR
jgi:hypothetical protein